MNPNETANANKLVQIYLWSSVAGVVGLVGGAMVAYKFVRKA